MSDLPTIAATAWAQANAGLGRDNPLEFGRNVAKVYCAASAAMYEDSRFPAKEILRAGAKPLPESTQYRASAAEAPPAVGRMIEKAPAHEPVQREHLPISCSAGMGAQFP